MKKINDFLRLCFLGPSYFYHKNLIKKSRKWDDIKILAFQESNKSSYCDKVVTKNEIIANPNKFINRKWWTPLKKARTGGTTGTPFSFHQDVFHCRQKERAYIFDVWSRIGYKPFDFRIVVRGNNNKGIRFNFFENAIIISQNYFKPNNRLILEELFNRRPYFLHVYPSTLFFLIDFFGIQEFQNLPILGVMAGSEAFPDSQIKWFESKFKLPVAHWYGHSEYAILARKCRVCGEFHFYPTYGKASLGGEKGTNVIATSFNKYGTQFKNYYTGDDATPSEVSCNEDSYFKVKTIIGRSQEYVWDKFGQKKAFGPFLFGIHNNFWDGLKSIQFLQKEKGVLQVYVALSSHGKIDQLEKILLDRFEGFNLNINMVEKIRKTNSGKHKYFIQKLDLSQ